MAKKKQSRTDAVRQAVDQAFQTQIPRERISELLDELGSTAGRLRGAVDELRPASAEEVKVLRADVQALTARVAALETAAAKPKPAPARRRPAATKRCRQRGSGEAGDGRREGRGRLDRGKPARPPPRQAQPAAKPRQRPSRAKDPEPGPKEGFVPMQPSSRAQASFARSWTGSSA